MESFNELLDEIENKIEEHRRQALILDEERQNYEKVLKEIENSAIESNATEISDVDKEEIQAVLERLRKRLSSVQVNLITHRNENQKEALRKVNEKLSDLIQMVHLNSSEAPQVAQSYLNSCSNGTGSKFEALLLSCTSDDQKAVKERIATILENAIAVKEETMETEETEETKKK